jgi:hypothetical protein
MFAASFTSASSVPYCDSHFAAVLGPTFGTPGMLSTESPVSVNRSSTWSGRTPNLAEHARLVERLVAHRVDELHAGPTSCARSLSDVEMMLSTPAARA